MKTSAGILSILALICILIAMLYLAVYASTVLQPTSKGDYINTTTGIKYLKVHKGFLNINTGERFVEDSRGGYRNETTGVYYRIDSRGGYTNTSTGEYYRMDKRGWIFLRD